MSYCGVGVLRLSFLFSPLCSLQPTRGSGMRLGGLVLESLTRRKNERQFK